MRLLLTSLAIILTSTIFAQKVFDWRGTDRTGIYEEQNLLKEWPKEGPELLWSDTTIGMGYTSVLADENRAFVAGMIETTGYIFCFDHSGKKLWESAYGKEFIEEFPGSRSNLILKDNALYFLSGIGHAFKMNASNGEIIWRVDLTKEFDGPIPDFGFSETALLVDDKVFFTPGGEHTMVALKQSDGSLIWKSPGAEGEESGYCSARLIDHNGKKIILQQTRYRLWGLDLNTGDSLWTYNIRNPYTDNSNPPYYFDGKIVVSSANGNGTFLFELNDDGSEIKLLWKNEALDIQSGSFVVINNHLYGSAQEKKTWNCLDLSTGEIKWSKRGIRNGSIIYADGLFYIFSDTGDLALVEPSTEKFKIISKFKAVVGHELFAHPCIKNGKLFIRAENQIRVYNIAK